MPVPELRPSLAAGVVEARMRPGPPRLLDYRKLSNNGYWEFYGMQGLPQNGALAASR
jgi:hypothetical protein